MKDQIKAILKQHFGFPCTDNIIENTANDLVALFSPAKLPDIIYFDSFFKCVSHAMNKAKERGYEVESLPFGVHKPESGRYERLSLTLTKNGNGVKELLHIQVYRMSEETFELNYYIQ